MYSNAEAKQIIAEAFWFDYSADLEETGAKLGSHVQVLKDFLEWLDLRKTSGRLIDLRLVRNQTAQRVVDNIMGVK